MLDWDNGDISWKVSIKLLCIYLVQHMLHLIKAQKFYSNLGIYQQCYDPQKIIEFKDFSRLSCGFFQYFSRQIYFSSIFQESPLNSSTFQACVNPVPNMVNVLKFWALDACQKIYTNTADPEEAVWSKSSLFAILTSIL